MSTSHDPDVVRIDLIGLTAQGRHGVFEFERVQGQRFVVDVSLTVARPSDQTTQQLDDLAATVDYGAVADRVVAHVTAEPWQLIESLAVAIADDLLTLALVRAVTVVVHKPQAPLQTPFTDVSVTISRSKHGD